MSLYTYLCYLIIVIMHTEGKNQFSLKRIQPTSYVFNKDSILGKGAYGEVFLGFDQKNRIPLAIKTISNQKINKVSSNEQPLKQKIAGQLGNMQICKSQRLVQLISPHYSSKNIYVVCEYCNGGSLKDYLSKKGQLSQYQTLNFFKDILEGLKCLHERKIVHRDMKPANLLLHNRRIKIGDLGFSKSISVHEQILTSTVGTPLYMSPQILSNTTYTQKTDVWSLGILLYQMIVGEVPWRVNSLQQIKQKVRHKPQFPKYSIISNRTKCLIMSMLQMQQKNRIGWQQLFKQHLLNDNTMQQQISPILAKMRQTNQHFLSSLALESEYHVIYVLEKNGRKFVDCLSGCQNGRAFFHRIAELRQEKKMIQGVVSLYVQCRNQIAFLMKLFMECYQNSQELASTLVYATMFMILKYCIAKTQSLLDNFAQGVQNSQTFYKSCYYTNLRQLFILDLQILTSLLKLFKSQLFIPKMKQIIEANRTDTSVTDKQLKPFLGQQSVSVKYTEFEMKNQYKQLFNAFKDTQKLEDHWMLIPRMIYQHQKSSKTHIFANMGEKSNMNRKLEAWVQEDRWKTKLRELKKYQIESLASFINREVQWNSFNMLNFGMKGPNFI